MNETFEIPVLYKGKELEFAAKLVVTGYTHKIVADVNGTEVSFEPDEESNYRAVIDQAKMEQIKNPDVELLKAIADSIEAIVK